VGGDNTTCGPGLDSLDKFSKARGNAQGSNQESVFHACFRKATSLLFWWSKLAYEKSRNAKRNMDSVAESFAAIKKVILKIAGVNFTAHILINFK
jgi:hypothetical protein